MQPAGAQHRFPGRVRPGLECYGGITTFSPFAKPNRERGFLNVLGDPFFANVAALLHFDGDFVDVKEHAFAAQDVTAQTSAANFKFGTRALWSDGAATPPFQGGIISDVASPDFAIAGDFTAECWYLDTWASAPVVFPNDCQLFDLRDGAAFPNNPQLWFQSDTISTVRLRCDVGGGAFSSLFFDSIPGWRHVALCRQGMGINNMSMFHHGLRVHQFSNGDAYPASRLAMGRVYTGFPSRTFVDEWRLTNNVARYSGATYEVPSDAFEDF